ncbi:peptidoglycan-binding protein [Ruegeria sp. R13_0]|uniref:peptidoglycan-binding domain-containing protein n=1 Tax=Ruegeria sp. R13_0 TaxID=2821099 RepID=UPI001ADC9EF6|nr:peptidoglycan-binding protein [Ruegeria sp. R13_0]MBO9432908.1 peptidoglycan-binding protein [Ruegeria sp. R13_0]
MAVLKKGSKGKDVAEAQKLLNKAGAKPKLEEDGDFGPLTEKQARAFQKKAKLSADGKIGDNTWAALKFGGPLPKRPEIMFEEDVKFDVRGGARKPALAKDVNQAIAQFEGVVTSANKKFASTRKALEVDVKAAHQRVEVAKKLAAQIELFDKSVKTDPAKAKKLVPQIESLNKQWEKLYLGYNGGDWRGKYLDVAIKDIERSLKALKGV